MAMSKALAFLFVCPFLLRSARAKAKNTPPFMLVSGISAAVEMCLVAESGNIGVDGAEAVLESCDAAIAAGDGRELWQHLPNGQISNIIGGKCIGLLNNVVSEGGTIALMGCDEATAVGDGRSAWEPQGSGQLKLSRDGEYCLSQRGSGVGVEDVAEKGAAVASNSADSEAHGANKAVDGRSSTFWASTLDPVGPVEFAIGFGVAKKVRAIGIQWAYPAKSFTVSLSSDSVKWQEAFATDSNVLRATNIPVGFALSAKARVVMHKAQMVRGIFQRHQLYGIEKFSVYASRLNSVVEECADASRSQDARDKYFQVYVGESTPCSSKSLRGEIPSFEAARASLGEIASELVDALPNLGSCRHAAVSFHKSASPTYANFYAIDKRLRGRHVRGATQLALDVEHQNNIDLESTVALMRKARAAILEVRSAIF